MENSREQITPYKISPEGSKSEKIFKKNEEIDKTIQKLVREIFPQLKVSRFKGLTLLLSMMNKFTIKFQSNGGKMKILKTPRAENKITCTILEMRFALK